jgi:hypothetical protein
MPSICFHFCTSKRKSAQESRNTHLRISVHIYSLVWIGLYIRSQPLNQISFPPDFLSFHSRNILFHPKEKSCRLSLSARAIFFFGCHSLFVIVVTCRSDFSRFTLLLSFVLIVLPGLSKNSVAKVLVVPLPCKVLPVWFIGKISTSVALR